MSRVGPNVCHVQSCDRGCTPDTGCQGHAWRELAPSHYLQRAQELVAEAERDGIVITIEQRSVAPLAMGRLETVVGVRAARTMAEAEA